MHLKSTLAAVLALSLASGPALALSCAPPDPVRTIEWAKENEKEVRVIHGELEADEGIYSTYEGGEAVNGKEDWLNAHLVGKDVITGEGVDLSITVHEQCFGPWCARIGLRPIPDAIFILEKDGGKLSLELSPCGGQIFHDINDVLISEINGAVQ